MLPQIVIDTNVVYAALYSRFGASNRLMRVAGKGRFDFHLSLPLILQYEDVLKRNALKILTTISFWNWPLPPDAQR
jgi:predicted nucleic acid-binding protein